MQTESLPNHIIHAESKSKLVQKLSHIKTRKGDQLSMIQVSSNPFKVCLSLRDALELPMSSQVYDVPEFIEVVFQKAQEESKTDKMNDLEFPEELKKAFKIFKEEVISAIDLVEKTFEKDLFMQSTQPDFDKFIGQCIGSPSSKLIEDFSIEWANCIQMTADAQAMKATERATKALNQIFQSNISVLNLLMKHQQALQSELRIKGCFSSSSKPLEHLQKPKSICIGSRGITKCGPGNFAILSEDGSLSLVNRDIKLTEKLKRSFSFPSESCYSSILANRLGTHCLISDSEQKNICFYDLAKGTAVKEWSTEQEPMRLAWLCDSKFISVFNGGLLSLFDVYQSASIKSFSLFPGQTIQDVCLTKDEKLGEFKDVICCGDNGRVFRVRLDQEKCVWTRQLHTFNFLTIALTSSGKLAAVGGHLKVYLVDTQTGEKVGGFDEYAGLTFEVYNIAFSPCSRFVCVLSENEVTMFTFDEKGRKVRETSQMKKEASGNSSGFSSMEVFWAERKIVIGDFKGNLIKLHLE